MVYNELKQLIERAWEDRALLKDDAQTQEAIRRVVELVDKGELRCAEPVDAEKSEWQVNEWVKKAVILYFPIQPMRKMRAGELEWFDKMELKRDYEALGVRVVPHAVARYGAYIAPGAILMPSYVNIGAYVDTGTMVDTWATVGSCAQIGKHVHLSGGVGIGGVLEPVQAAPVIIEDNCFIGSRSIVVEGAHVCREAVLGSNTVITGSTHIVDVTGPEPVTYKGYVPPRSVVVPGSYRPEDAELWYDRIVAFGELISTTIISEYLAYAGVPNRWIDMRRALVTEQRHKDAEVDLNASAPRLRAEVEGCKERIFVGQGFIGGAPDGTTTTLGREGSDYSAAVAANILDAESMAVWKDVDGVLNADPKIFPDAVQIAELNYLDTIELAYSGAQIIHPRTIKPLQNKNIPLYVRPFGDKRKPGTVIRGMSAPVDVPILILKKDQVLLTIRSRDFSFVLEEKFAAIFALLELFRVKANLIHNSAVNLSLCVDDSWHIDEAVAALRAEGFDVMKIERMELLTVRGYTEELWRRHACGPQVFIRQATQSTVRIVRKAEIRQ